MVWCRLVTWPGWWVLPRHVLVCVRCGSSGGTAEARPLGPAGRRTSKSRAGARQCKGLAERVSMLPSRYVRRFRHGCLACCKVHCGHSQVGVGVTNASELGVTLKLKLVLKQQGLMLVRGMCSNIILETVLPDVLRRMQGNGVVFGNFIFVAGRPRVQTMGGTSFIFFV